MELTLVLAVVPYEMTNILFGSFSILLNELKMILEFGSHCPQIMDRVGMFPGAFEVQSVYFVLLEHKVYRVCIVVDQTALLSIPISFVPPFSKQSVEHFSSR